MKKIQFIRFGGLSSVPQKGYDPKMPTMHSPPARRGIYAFVWPYIEYFLLGGGMFDQRRMQWVRNIDGTKVKAEDYDKFDGYREKKHSAVEKPPIPDRGKRIRRLENEGAATVFDPDNHFLAEHIRPKKFSYEGDIWHHLETLDRPAMLEEKGSWFLSSYSDFVRAFHKEVGKMDDHKRKKGYGFTKDHLEVFIEKV